ncbi:MAG: hypothetical protein QOE51_4567 [Actinoplanes sp.]|nr:hypothetical protein [Actinoplanes sp.]
MTTHTTTTTATTTPATAAVSDDRTVVAVAWPTGRPIYAYTREELAEGVDLYTCHLKARRRPGGGERHA